MAIRKSSYSIRHMTVNINYLSRVLLRKPQFLLRLARNYTKVALNPQRPPLRLADVAVTYNCTMWCSHCSAREMERKGQQPLTVEQYKTIAGKLLKAGLLVVNFTGGEPLIRKDFFDIIKVFQPNKLLVAVQTNASLMTDAHLRELKRLGVDSISISIDGAEADIHDKFRNFPGAFDKAISVLEAGRMLGFNMGISYCLTHENLYSEDRRKMVELSKKYDALLNYNLAVPIGFWKGKFEGLITSDDRKYLKKILEEYPKSKTDFETNYYKKGCGAIKEKLYVNAYGEVIPCPFIQISFGNLLQDTVAEVRERAFQYRYFNAYAPMCIAAEDRDFIMNTICYSKDAAHLKLPIPHTEAFIDRRSALTGRGFDAE